MAVSRTHELFRNFVGSWRVTRSLGNAGSGSGVAKFVPGESEEVLKYREDLEVSYNGAETLKGSAWKEYVYSYDRTKDKILKSFSDGRDFYEMKVNFVEGDKDLLAVAVGEHLCEKDLYNAAYEFPRDQSRFVLSYAVRGPQKDYVIRTEFSRMVDS